MVQIKILNIFVLSITLQNIFEEIRSAEGNLMENYVVLLSFPSFYVHFAYQYCIHTGNIESL